MVEWIFDKTASRLGLSYEGSSKKAQKHIPLDQMWQWLLHLRRYLQIHATVCLYMSKDVENEFY